jgi:hypothetical protein
MIDVSHMLPHVMWLIVTWVKYIMVSTCVDNKYNMIKISQWNYECNINMTKMSKGKYTCSTGDVNMTNICHMRLMSCTCYHM